MEFDEKLMNRIWLAINKTDTCWLSKYSIKSTGYTEIGISKNSITKIYRFHRLMLFWNDQTKTTEFNDGKNWLACHTCRNKHCVNPAHLYWGTPLNNGQDKIRDGTNGAGINNNKNKLTEAQVLEIREKYSKKKSKYDREITTRKLAIEYGVNSATLYNIISRKLWSHLPQTPD